MKNKDTKKKAKTAKKKSPQEIRQAHIDWFLKRSPEEFSELSNEWQNRYLGVRGNRNKGYNEWLDYFKTLPASEVQDLIENEGSSVLSVEAYTALKLWGDIIDNPQRISKVYQAGITKEKEGRQSIVELAKANDTLGTFCAIRDDLAAKLEKGMAARDQSQTAKTLMEVMDNISEIERRRGPSENTELARILSSMSNIKTAPEVPKKRTRAKGARNTSFKSKTIKELEDEGQAPWMSETED